MIFLICINLAELNILLFFFKVYINFLKALEGRSEKIVPSIMLYEFNLYQYHLKIIFVIHACVNYPYTQRTNIHEYINKYATFSRYIFYIYCLFYSVLRSCSRNNY